MEGLDVSNLLRAFDLRQPCDCVDMPQEITGGHINTTYAVAAKCGDEIRRYCLQRINTQVFPHPQALMENIFAVTEFLQAKIKRGAGAGQQTLTMFRTKSNELFHRAPDGSCWRCANYLENTLSLQAAESLEDAYRAGCGFGTFLRLLDGFPIAGLHETIPNFHHTPKRLDALEAAIAADVIGRAAAVQPEIAFVRARAHEVDRAVRLAAEGKLPVRVTHNDTKLNNILFRVDDRSPLCVVDLDTVMPGLSLYDFGDALRFLASTAPEDERDLSRVDFNLDVYNAYQKGYLETAGDALTPLEVSLLTFSVKLMTFECGCRFLTDYLCGDTYFKIHRPDDNLARCRTQFKLVAAQEEKLGLK